MLSGRTSGSPPIERGRTEVNASEEVQHSPSRFTPLVSLDLIHLASASSCLPDTIFICCNYRSPALSPCILSLSSSAHLHSQNAAHWCNSCCQGVMGDYDWDGSM
uniref:Uncharacterized protein n=1 Tax=Knipowitschia caucasica TaxID=637954 RepID=A0AAV2LV58_KNICA